MKKLEISRLMDEYVDNEFFPKGGSVADSEAVKGWVLANAKAPARGKKKQTPKKKKKALLVAALAAVLVVLAGAGFPYLQHRLVAGDLIFEQTNDGRITALVHYGPIVEEENGRLFFNPDDGQRVDITDLISEETPYIYDGSDSDSGKSYYIIIGGRPEHYGYLEWITAPSPFDDDPASGAAGENGQRIRTVYTLEYIEQGDTHTGGSFFDIGTVQLFEGMDTPWLLAGMDQLGIPYEHISETLEKF